MANKRSEIRVVFSTTDRQEMAVANFMTNTSQNMRKLAMDAWLRYYVVQGLLKTEGAEDEEILERAIESINYMQAQIGIIEMAVRSRGIEIPRSNSVGSRIQREARKPKKRKDDEDEFLEEPPLTPVGELEINLDD
jgi:hypothetical protein